MIVSFFRPHTVKKTGERVPGALPLPYEFSWPSFTSYLSECADEPAPRSHKQVPTVEVNAIGMADYPDDARRGLEAAIGADWIGLDIDDKDGATDAWKFEGLVDFLTDAGVAFAVYTTTSCTADRHCLRVILPFDRRVGAAEWPNVWAAFAAWIGQVDARTKDISRILYEPRQWQGAYNRFYASSPDLPPVIVDEIVDRYLAAMSLGPTFLASDRAAPADRELRTVQNLDDFDGSPIIRQEWVEDAYRSRVGGRMYSFLCRVALSARAQEIALDQFELSEIGRRLAALIGRQDLSDIARDANRALDWASRIAIEPRLGMGSRLPPPWPWSRG